MTLTDADILSRLTNIEDATVERKTMSDWRDWVKAAVAFSNSLPEGDPGIIYIGVYNDGRIEDKGISETTVDKVSGELSNIYPPILPQILVREKDGKKFIAVIVRGSPNKPHFTGQSYIRQGTRSVPASEKQFEELVAMRNSKAEQILKWKNKLITLDRLNSAQQGLVATSMRTFLLRALQCVASLLLFGRFLGAQEVPPIELSHVEGTNY
jgi:predicted HTH transcriptional regulator